MLIQKRHYMTGRAEGPRLNSGGSAKNPGREFLMDCEKDKIGKFERGYLESNHRKVSGFGLSQDAKRLIASFGTAAWNRRT